MRKILWVKFGWSDFYRGGPVDGNFPFIAGGEQGHEAWNFKPQSDGVYCCYTPPQGGSGTPANRDPEGWTVVCLARKPKRTGIYVVGWYEDATLAGRYVPRPAGFDPGTSATADGEYIYSISAPTAYLVPPEARDSPFSHTSIRQGKYSFLAGPGVEISSNKRQVLTILERELARLRKVAIPNPDRGSAPDIENDEADPLGGFGSPEHRKEVEEKAVTAAKEALRRTGYRCISRESENVGYDLEATRDRDGDVLHVEVKGTSGDQPRLFMTANEHLCMGTPQWRLAMVTHALGTPRVKLYSLHEFREHFDLAPLVWKGTVRNGRGSAA